MPALQVKDFPDDLYAKLKECAARNHRSMSQQTVAYVGRGWRARVLRAGLLLRAAGRVRVRSTP